MILVLDTTEPTAVRFALADEKGDILDEQEKKTDEARLDTTKLILSFLEEHHAVKKITGVIVRDGTGTFSGVRLGVLLANSLALAFHIPVSTVQVAGNPSMKQLLKKGLLVLHTREPGMYVVPEYHKAPNITKPKKR